MATSRTRSTTREPVSKDRLRLWLRLLRSSRFIEAEIRERLRLSFGITLPQFDVMSALNRSESGLIMSEISRFLMVSNGNVTGIVDRLVADGLAKRVQDAADRRKNQVRLTAKGRRAFVTMAVAHEGWIDELLGIYGSGELPALTETLERIVPAGAGGSG